jgi:transcriptional regulator with XRE-family HTH domain
MAALLDELSALARRRIELEDDERALVAQALDAGWTYTEIAKRLGVSRQAVAQRATNPIGRRPGARAAANARTRQQTLDREYREFVESVYPLEQRLWYRRMKGEAV